MNSSAVYRFALPLGLLLLVFCSTSLALECYQCAWLEGECTIKQTCDPTMTSCMRVTQIDSGMKYHSCRTYNTCNIKAVKEELQLQSNIKLDCCQYNLCNKGFTGLPASGLILCLSAALLLLFS
uniref:CD59 glycoprotein n=1 Tax=Pyxicephalus adspersus TaxID=30357 RepID=A0AAV3A1S2_PYXAD|nr:TPA: hypothetical protein GDO54_002959 [Pyxicephalus adspersus]